MLYQSCPHLLNAHFVTQHQQFLASLMEDACKKPETVSTQYCEDDNNKKTAVNITTVFIAT